MDQVAGQMMFVELVQVEVAQVVVGDFLGKRVIDGDQDLVSDGRRGSLVPRPRFETVKLVSQVRALALAAAAAPSTRAVFK